MKITRHGTKGMSVDSYRNYKMRMLNRDFCIGLTDEEVEHFNSLQTEDTIDRYFRKLLNDHWD